jgi:pimeloyl-ACP methyl ester carboxylesterase
MPRGAATGSLPAVVEYMPYRKRDATRQRDEPIHAWFAARGYAALRVDMHGSGDSDGILAQEFQKQEQEDACEIVAWIAAQPWCSGAVALFGKSWGAFSALQAALRRLAEMPDEVRILPGHTAGSLCGRSICALPQSSLRIERRINGSLRAAEDDGAFMDKVLRGLPDPPAYFVRVKRRNIEGERVNCACPVGSMRCASCRLPPNR